MTVISTIPLLICVLGVLTWAFAKNPKLSEAGKIAFACGLLVTLFAYSGSGTSLHLGK